MTRCGLLVSIICAVLPGFGGTATHGLVTARLGDNQFVLTSDASRSLCYAPGVPAPKPGDEISYAYKSACADPTWLDIIHGLKVLRHGEAPAPMLLTVDELALGDHNLRTVTVEGRAEDAFQDEIDERWIHIRLIGPHESVLVSAHKTVIGTERLTLLPGSHIAVTGICMDSTPGRRHYVGRRILLQHADDLTIVRPAPDDPLNFPPLVLKGLTHAHTISQLGRQSLTGAVVAAWGSSRILIDTGTATVQANLADGETLPRAGDQVKVAGIPETDLFKVILTSSRIRVLAAATLPPEPIAQMTDPDLLFAGFGGKNGFDDRFFDKTVRLEGSVRDLPQSTFSHVPWNLICGKSVIPVDTSANPDALRSIRPGSRLSVTGVVIPVLDYWRPSAPFPRVSGIILVPRSRSDLVVLDGPPWWTVGKLLTVVILLVAAFAAFVVWHVLTRLNARSKIAERTRLAVELHDSLSQNLTGIAFQLATTKTALAAEPASVARHLETAERMLLSSRTELRRCLWDLRVNTLEDNDFSRAIRHTVEPVLGTATAVIRFQVSRQQLNDSLAHTVLCILRELVANATQHGKAKTLRIAGALQDRKLSFSVRDDGCGFDPSQRPDGTSGHFGLDGVAERVDRLEGRIEIKSLPGTGTRVTITEIRL